MKKVLFLSVVIAIALLGTQVFASPPIKPPTEGFIIHSFTEIISDPTTAGKNSVTESESFNWMYFEGWGSGPFYPLGQQAQFQCGTNDPYCVREKGFTEGAQIRYEQTFNAQNGSTTFSKTFDAKSDPGATGNNLVVTKQIDFLALDPTTGYAKHTEKVGLSVISMGAIASDATPASDFLSLCPWTATTSSATSGGGYPITNEGIAAGSSFDVTKLVGFETKSNVNSSVLPFLSYDVTGQGEGTIKAGFIVDLWEGPDGLLWTPKKASEITACYTCKDVCTTCLDTGAPYVLPAGWYGGQPPTASKTEYKESASATGVWTFTKNVSYKTTLPGAGSSATYPWTSVP